MLDKQNCSDTCACKKGGFPVVLTVLLTMAGAALGFFTLTKTGKKMWQTLKTEGGKCLESGGECLSDAGNLCSSLWQDAMGKDENK